MPRVAASHLSHRHVLVGPSGERVRLSTSEPRNSNDDPRGERWWLLLATPVSDRSWNRDVEDARTSMCRTLRRTQLVEVFDA